MSFVDSVKEVMIDSEGRVVAVKGWGRVGDLRRVKDEKR